jgi:RNA methyltransferase, TrmH family
MLYINKAKSKPVTNAEFISSPSNPLLKDVRRALARGTTTPDGFCVAETFHLLEEALRSGCEVKAVIAAKSARGAVERRVQALAGFRFLSVPDSVFEALSDTETTQGVLALVRLPAWTLDDVLRDPVLAIVLDGVQDPGNAGAILRAAEAFGATGLLFLKGTVNPANPKTVRASAGSIFRVPLVADLDPAATRAALDRGRLDVYAAMPTAERLLPDADLRRNCAFIIGSEGRGVSDRLRSAALDLRIPVSGVESLNAAMAAGILLYEARRQRNVPK